MNSKKEMFAASLLAIALAAGLGTISYGLFSGAPLVLDVYTTKSTVGGTISGATFEPFDVVPIYAYLTQGGIQVANSQVSFTITKPDGTTTMKTAPTDNSGVAETVLSLLPSESHLIGTWQILANASVNNQAAEGTLTLQCKSQSAQIEVFSERNGATSTSFLPTDQVLLEAQLFYKNASIAGAPATSITFEVKTPNNTKFLSQAVPTDSLGTANVTFQIPWNETESDLSLGTWKAKVTSEIFQQAVNATQDFDCELVPPVIDVYTQQGGQGQNTPGGTFKLNQKMFLYAEIRDSINQTVPNNQVAFELKSDNTTSKPWNQTYVVSWTDNSGIATAATTLPPDPAYAGTWEVYATTTYRDIVLIDTLTFVATA